MADALDKKLTFNQFRNIDTIAILIDPTTGNIEDANTSALNYYGYTKDEFCSMKIQTINQLSKKEVEMEMKAAKTKKKNYFSFEHQLKNGEIRDVEVYSGPITIKNKEYLFSIIYDITNTESKIGDIKDRIERMDVVVICAHCHRIRDGNSWIPSQLFLEDKMYYKSHSICEYCLKKHFPEYADDDI